MSRSLTEHLKAFVLRHHIGVLATNFEGRPEAATIFYVSKDGLRLYYKSRTASRHARSLLTLPSVALCIYDHSSDYTEKWGVQLIGSSGRVVEKTEMELVVDLYGAKFGLAASKKLDLAELLSPETSSTFFWLDLREFKSVSADSEFQIETYTPVEE